MMFGIWYGSITKIFSLGIRVNLERNHLIKKYNNE